MKLRAHKICSKFLKDFLFGCCMLLVFLLCICMLVITYKDKYIVYFMRYKTQRQQEKLCCIKESRRYKVSTATKK